MRHLTLLLALVLTIGLHAPPAFGGVDAARTGDDADPIAAAITISQRLGQADQVVLGRADLFADNLAATALTSGSAPLLLTEGGPDGGLPTQVEAEIQRLLGQPSPCQGQVDVYLVGGVNAISEATQDQVEGMGYCSRRLAGPGRVQTAVVVAREVRRTGGGTDVVIARADDWADAATAGAWASRNRVPVVVTDRVSLHPDVQAFLNESGSGTAWLVGGSAALAPAVEQAVPAQWNVRRVAGPTREGTAVAVLEEMWGPQARSVALVNGRDTLGWAYAFAAAWLGQTDDRAQLYALQDGSLATESRDAITARTPESVLAVGTPTLVSDAALQEATGGGPPPADGPSFRAVYVIPSDVAPFDGREAGIANVAEEASRWLNGQTGDLTPRFARDGGAIDVVVINAPATEAEFNAGTVDYRSILADIRVHPDDVPMAWVEAGDPAGGTCGYTSFDDTGRSIIMEMDACGGIYPSPSDVFPYNGTYLPTHEMVHAFGAVPSCAPNHDGTGHVTDDARDILSSVGRDFENLVLDVGNDDYFRHGIPGCTDIADSPLWEVQ